MPMVRSKTFQAAVSRREYRGVVGQYSVELSSLDTAKVFLILNGTSGTLWKGQNGNPVTRSVLSNASRAYFQKELGEQGLNRVLSTTNWCGRAYPTPGMPQKISDRWVDPATGTVTADGRVYGQDARPCQAKAQVRFAHKTGLADTSGNDAGVVHSLPGKTATTTSWW